MKTKVPMPQYIKAIRDGTVPPKGWMRNLSCVCGSGEKFKECCYQILKQCSIEKQIQENRQNRLSYSTVQNPHSWDPLDFIQELPNEVVAK